MDSTSSELPPGCLVVLISLSAGMAEDVRVRLAHRYTPEGEPDLRDLPKGFVARFLADELLDGLVNALAAGYPVPLDVAAFGYWAGESGKLEMVSLLPGGSAEKRFIPLVELANSPVEHRTLEGDPRKWITGKPCEGSAPAALAMAEVYALVSVWLTGRYEARPPVVIHCTDGEGLDEAYARVSRSLGLLATAYGAARLLHFGFAIGLEPVLSGSWPDAVPAPWNALMDLSSVLPAELEGRPSRSALSVNDWTVADAWSALFDHIPVGHSDSWTAAEGARFSPSVRELWTQKMGNKPEEWEDAFATDAIAGAVAIADGASSGIYCRTWADSLTKRFLTDRPDPRNSLAFGKWVHGLRGEWRTSIAYPTLNWAKQRKVDEVGAAATFLALETGPLDEFGNRPWRACAVGDASLFWVRNGKLLASFPVVAADQFGSAPLLIRSNPGFKTQVLNATGVSRAGDYFLLATDAVAARLLKSSASGPGPDWERFATIEEEEWRKELDALRRERDMVNDDCTLVVLQIMSAVFPPAQESAPSESSSQTTDADPAEGAILRAGDMGSDLALEAENARGEGLDLPSEARTELQAEPPSTPAEPARQGPLPLEAAPDARDGFSESAENRAARPT